MEVTTHTLHTAKLTNNCPECYGTAGLEFTFSQDLKDSLLFKKPSKNIKETLLCHNCNTNIYPVNWTEDIERVHEYNRKLAEEQRLKTTVKPAFYMLILIDLAVVAGLVYYFTR